MRSHKNLKKLDYVYCKHYHSRIITMPIPVVLKQRLLTKCGELRRNDPSVTSLDLKKYGKLDWDITSYLAGALTANTRVRELLLYLSEQ